jgi:hypothetical protein
LIGMKRIPNYDKTPVVSVPAQDGAVERGWPHIGARLREALAVAKSSGRPPVIAIETYVGVRDDQIRRSLAEAFGGTVWIHSSDALLPGEDIDRLVAPYLGGSDPIFGYLTRLTLPQFFDSDKLGALRERITREQQTVIVYGVGASLIAPRSAVLVYADLPRWEAQQRQRRNEISNLGVENRTLRPSLQYKRSFFVDWRVCDRLKQSTLAHWDFILDTTLDEDPKLVRGEAFRRALAHCVTRPFRVVPLFDPGPWGGQWMKEVCDLDRERQNFAWCFDCVPEENSLLLEFGSTRIEVPALDLVLAEPRALLGEPVVGRFGAEFPIRFDFLDTMGGGNLSLQVHPLTQYMREHFGVPYTQDESYYILDAQPGACVYLGRRGGTDFDEMFRELEAAQRGERLFDADRYVARFPASRHDHFLIPAGTLHCSGRDSMVLEISATPYIFTFKLWDWGRAGLDGLPRPINIARGRANVLWERDQGYAERRLINQVKPISGGQGWREERTGLHEAEFIETRRHWFTSAAPHDSGGAHKGSVNVLNLVEGEEAIVESPERAFEPFVIHYAETFIVPAAIGRYNIRPYGRGLDTECATIKAFVRCQP